LLALALLLSLVLPRLAAASDARPAVELGEGVARIHVETNADASVVVVEWGLAPNLSKVARSSGSKVHDLALQGLEPGRIYVYRVVVDGKVVTPPTPFRTAGEVPAPQPRPGLIGHARKRASRRNHCGFSFRTAGAAAQCQTHALAS